MTQENLSHNIRKHQPSSLKDVFKAFGYFMYYASVIFFIAFSVLFLGLKFVILPNINHYHNEISKIIYEKSKVKITIDKINANWDGLNPFLQIENIKIYNKNNEVALNLSLQSSLEWMHMLGGNILFDQIMLQNTHLLIEKDEKGQFHVAGIPLTSEKSDSSIGDWLLTQPAIYIKNSTVIWRDKQSNKADLALSNVQFLLKNSVYQNKHEFGLTAIAPHEFGGTFDIRGQMNGSKLDLIHLWESNYYIGLKVRELSALHKYFDLPIELNQGGGDLNVWLNTELGHIKDASAQFSFFDFDAKLANSSEQLMLQYVKGILELKRNQNNKYEFTANNITALTQQEFLLPRSNIKSVVHLDEKNKLKVDSFELDIPVLNLSNLLVTAKSMPLSEKAQHLLVQTAPKGDMKNIKFSWQNNYPKKNHFKLTGEFLDFSNRAYENIPSIQHLSGKIEATQLGGTIFLTNHEQQPFIFTEKNEFDVPLQLNQLKANLEWHFDLHNNLEINLKEFIALNQHLSAKGSAEYKAFKDTLGDLNLNMQFDQVDAKNVYQYLPNVIGKDVKAWLKTAILQGESKNTRIVFKGNLSQFPFANDKQGVFEVYSKVNNGQLQFLDKWQPIEKITTDFILHNNRMDIKASSGLLNQTKITDAHIYIEDLSAKNIDLNIKGNVLGQTQDFLSYIIKNPLNQMIGGATQDFKGKGNGKLALELKIPLSHPVQTTVKGIYSMTDNEFSLGKGLPVLNHLYGNIEFSEKEVKGNQLKTVAFNSPTSASFLFKNNNLDINLNSNIDASNFIQQQKLINLDQSIRNGLNKTIYGRSLWNAKIALNTKTNAINLNIGSDLKGTTLNFPDGLNKSSNTISRLNIEAKPLNLQTDQIKVSIDKLLNAQFLLNSKQGTLDQSLISLGDTESNHSKLASGLLINAILPKITVDEWIEVGKQFSSGTNSSQQSSTMPMNFDIKTDLLEIKKKPIHKMHLQGKSNGANSQFTISSNEINGILKLSNNKLTGKFKNITITPDMLKPQPVATKSKEEISFGLVPHLDIDIDQFEFNGKKLGKVDIATTTKSKELSIDKFIITNPDSVVKAHGSWQPLNTKISYESDIYDGGKLLKRLNKSGVLKHTSAKFKGNLYWNGSPVNFAIENLNGNFIFEAKDGQFLKVDPGVAKLLSVLSLQSIPKRISLDFKDVFSEGFAFDEMYGKFNIDKGIVHINDFRMAGSLAGVSMKGKVNLNNETQNIFVRVVPNTIGDTISIASSVFGGPIGGLSSMFLQKILKNPLNKLTAFDLSVTGSLENPKIDKESIKDF